MAGYLQHCPLCQVQLSSREEWSVHLLEAAHQTKARSEVGQWDQNQRNGALVLYSSFELVTTAAVDGVLEYFGSQSWNGNAVTDLVLSPTRPHLAVIKFETVDKLEELFLRTGHSTRVDNQLVQFKKLGQVLELEWKELLFNFQDLNACTQNAEDTGSSGKKGSTKAAKVPTNKGSRRTPSLLNLFIPQGNKSNSNSSTTNTTTAISSSNNNNNSSKQSQSVSSSNANAPTTDSTGFDLLGGISTSSVASITAASNATADANSKPNLSRSSNSRGSKLPESSGIIANSPIVRTTLNNNEQSNDSASTTDNMLTTKVFGFLRNRRGKKKDKKRKKKDGNSSGKEEKSEGEEKDESQKSETPTAEIDEEGYSVPVKSTWENDKSSFYSSSDTDSDDEREKRLHIEIKPLSNGTAPLSASVDELRSTVENLTLSPAGMTGAFCNTLKSRKLLHEADSQMKRSQSVSQQIGSSSPPSRHPYTPLSPPIPPPNPRSSPKLPVGAVIGGPTDTVTSTTSASSRYADLGDLFAEIGDVPTSNFSTLTKSSLSSSHVRNTPTPTTNNTTIPRPASRPRPEGLGGRNSTNSPSPAISRTESIGSLERSLGAHIIGSRGPSPLTIGMADTIPLAVAFHEIVHASFKGNDESLCQVRMTGDMMVSFPAGIMQVFANNPSPAQLSFHVRSAQPLDNLVSNRDLVQVEKVVGGLSFEFNMSALVVMLKNHAEQNPSASYFNIDILKYHITPKSGAASCPLHLVAFWKCEPNQTDLRIDYKYNSHAMATTMPDGPSSFPGSSSSSTPTTTGTITTYPPLLQVCVAAPVDGGVKSMQSKPNGQWFPNTNRACWKIPALSYSNDNQGIGSLRARFEISNGPSAAGTIAAQFSCENSTLSGCEFQLSGTGYRVSLIKKRFVSGKYTCEAVDNASRYALPPGNPASESGSLS